MSIKEIKFIDKNGRLVMGRLSRGFDQEDDRAFDIEFWQRLSDQQRMDAMWELVVTAHQMKGGDPSELRLQRSVENIKRGRR